MNKEPKKLNKVVNLMILGLTAGSLITLVLIIFMLVFNFGNSTSIYSRQENMTILLTIANLSVALIIGLHLAKKRKLI